MTQNGTAERKMKLLTTLRRWPNKLRWRFLILALLASFPSLIFTFYLAFNEKKAALDGLRSEVEKLAEIVSREHSYHILGAKRVLYNLAAITNTTLDIPEMSRSEYFNFALLTHPELVNIGLILPNGKVVESAYDKNDLPNMSTNPAYIKAMGSNKVEVGRYITGPIVDRPTLNLALAVRDSKGNIDAVVFNALNLDWLSDFAKKIKLPEGYITLITDDVGQIITSSSSKLDRSSLKEQYQAKEISLKNGDKTARLNIDGESWHFYFNTISDTPGINVGVGFSEEQIIEKANSVFLRVFVGLSIILFITIISIIFATEVSILRAIRILSKTSKQLEQGDLGIRAEVDPRYGELHELANDFNLMAESLEKRHLQLSTLKNQLRSLSQHLQTVREEEALRISRDLHDQVGQLLTSIKLDVFYIANKSKKGPIDSKDLDDINQKIDEAVNFVRKLSSELRPTVLDRLGFISGVKNYLSEVSKRSDIDIDFEAHNFDLKLDHTLSINLFRIVQESVTNILRHAHALNIKVQLEHIHDKIILKVQDDGIGIDERKLSNSGSVGITGMKERARIIKAKIDIESNDSGTTITVIAPDHGEEEVTR